MLVIAHSTTSTADMFAVGRAGIRCGGSCVQLRRAGCGCGVLRTRRGLIAVAAACGAAENYAKH